MGVRGFYILYKPVTRLLFCRKITLCSFFFTAGGVNALAGVLFLLKSIRKKEINSAEHEYMNMSLTLIELATPLLELSALTTRYNLQCVPKKRLPFEIKR